MTKVAWFRMKPIIPTANLWRQILPIDWIKGTRWSRVQVAWRPNETDYSYYNFAVWNTSYHAESARVYNAKFEMVTNKWVSSEHIKN